MGRTSKRSAGKRSRNASSARQGVQSADQKLSRSVAWPSASASGLSGARARVQGDVAQRLRRAPVLPQPGQRRGIVGPAPEQRGGHRQQRVQVERAAFRAGGLSHGQFVAAADGIAQLGGQDAGAGDAEAALLRRRRSGEQVEPALLHAVEVEVPGDHPAASRLHLEGCHVGDRAGNGEQVMQPVGVGQPERRYGRPGGPGAARARGEDRWVSDPGPAGRGGCWPAGLDDRFAGQLPGPGSFESARPRARRPPLLHCQQCDSRRRAGRGRRRVDTA